MYGNAGANIAFVYSSADINIGRTHETKFIQDEINMLAAPSQANEQTDGQPVHWHDVCSTTTPFDYTTSSDSAAMCESVIAEHVNNKLAESIQINEDGRVATNFLIKRPTTVMTRHAKKHNPTQHPDNTT